MRKHHIYKIKRVIIHFLRPLIENCVFISGFQRAKLFRFIGYKNIGKDCFIGTNVYLDEVNPLGIHIGNGCTITRGGVILSHFYNSHSYKWYSADVFIEDNVFVGCNAIICKGIKIGKNTIIGAGTILNKDCEENSVYAGVPAKKVGVHTGRYFS